MSVLLEFPKEIYLSCMGQGVLIPMATDIICYKAGISVLSHICQYDTLEKPNYLDQASQKRINEFFAGRMLAQAILKQYFNETHSITSLQYKLPIWSDGIIGSISHSNDLVVVAISSHSKYLGIDLEYIVATSFAEESMQLILTQFEQELWQTGKIEHLSFCEYLTLIFSLKESLYKAVFPVAQSYIDFLEATVVEIDIKRQMVRLKFNQEIRQRYKLRFEYQGFWVFQQDHVITWVAK